MYPEAFHAGIMDGGGEIKGLISEWDPEKAPSGSNLVPGQPSFTFASVVENAFQMDGTNAAIEINGLGELLKTGCTFEIVCSTKYAHDKTIIDAGTTSLSSRGMWARRLGNYLVDSLDYRTNIFKSVYCGIGDENIHYYAFVCDGNKANLTIDDFYKCTSESKGVTQLRDSVRFSNGIVYNSPIESSIYLAKIYNRTLSAEEITYNFSKYKERFDIR